MFDVLSALEERRNNGVVYMKPGFLGEARRVFQWCLYPCCRYLFGQLLSQGFLYSSEFYAIVTPFAFRLSYVPISFTIARL